MLERAGPQRLSSGDLVRHLAINMPIEKEETDLVRTLFERFVALLPVSLLAQGPPSLALIGASAPMETPRQFQSVQSHGSGRR